MKKKYLDFKIFSNKIKDYRFSINRIRTLALLRKFEQAN